MKVKILSLNDDVVAEFEDVKMICISNLSISVHAFRNGKSEVTSFNPKYHKAVYEME